MRYIIKRDGRKVLFNQDKINNALRLASNAVGINDEEKITSPKNKLISEVISYINENITNKILIKNIAEKLSLSESRISHVFKNSVALQCFKL